MKRVVLVSLGLMLVAANAGCLPADTGTTGTGGSTGTAGTGNSGAAGNDATGTAGTSGAAGNPGTAGTSSTGAAGDGNPGTAGMSNPGTAGEAGGSGGGAGTGGATGNGGRGGTTGGRGGTNGTAGTGGGAAGASGTAGTTGTGGSAMGTAGRGGSNGTAGTGGSAAGASGTAGTTGTGGGSGNVVCDSVKAALDGFQYLLPCGADQSYSVLVCQNPRPACTYNNSEYLVQGTCNADKKFTIAGTSSQSCTITLHVQGIVEPKRYFTGTNRCTTYFGMPYEGFAQGPAAGGVNSGCYPNTSGNYNVYMMHVSDSTTVLGTSVTGTRYYWNAINKTEAHFSYKIDYTTPTITIKGGTTLWMLADDSNQSAIKNCDTTSIDQATTAAGGKCNPLTLSGLTTAPGPAITQPYGGQFITLHVASAQ
jgi:hypothetical protein